MAKNSKNFLQKSKTVAFNHFLMPVITYHFRKIRWHISQNKSESIQFNKFLSDLQSFFVSIVPLPLHKVCENTGFRRTVFSRIRIKLQILSLYGRIRVSKNPYSRIFYAVCPTALNHISFNNQCFVTLFQGSLCMMSSTEWKVETKQNLKPGQCIQLDAFLLLGGLEVRCEQPIHYQVNSEKRHFN